MRTQYGMTLTRQIRSSVNPAREEKDERIYARFNYRSFSAVLNCGQPEYIDSALSRV